MKRLLTAIAAALLTAACAPSAADPAVADQWRDADVEALPVEIEPRQVGGLVFRGGVDLRSSMAMFGGFSGFEVLDGDRFVAVSDYGDWYEGRLVLDEAGALVDVAGVRTALMRDENGEPFIDKEHGDAEALTQLADGRFAVSFEQSQTIRIYDLNRDGPFGAAADGPRLEGAARLPRNSGLEALAITDDGRLVVGAEGGGGAATPVWIVRPEGAATAAAERAYRPRSGFSLTGLDRLPDGGFVALERFYAPIIGARARIFMFAEAALQPSGEIANVEELALLAPPLPVDNFEGIAATRMPDGTARIYIVSDNNFSPRQRTLIYAFDLVPDPAR